MADPLAVTEITLTTPTGHQHRSRAPDQPATRHQHHRLPRRTPVRALLLNPAA